MSELLITSLDFFPSELFIEIFGYLNGFDIYKAFYGLNYRLSRLVLTYGVKYIDLKETKLYESQKILSDINCSEITTLKLSNKYNDEQIDQILNENYFSFAKLDYLRSLTLDSIGLFTFNAIRSQHFELYHLEALIIRFRSDLCREKLFPTCQFILHEFCLRFKSLKLLDLSTADVDEISIETLESPVPSMGNSPFLKFLPIGNIRHDRIKSILSQFPNLYKLNVTIKLPRTEADYPFLSNLTFCTLKIHSFGIESITHFLKQCPNLKQLILYINSEDSRRFDSYEMGNLIEENLSKLKKFQMHLLINSMSPNTMDLFCNDFAQNQFWLDRHTKINVINQKAMIDHRLQAEIIIEFSI